MKIYTKTGDDGTTGLYGGGEGGEDDARVEAYGAGDEKNARSGVARATGLAQEIDAVLARVQEGLFTMGAELACVAGKEDKLGMPLIGVSDIQRLEGAIDASEEGLAPLRSFV